MTINPAVPTTDKNSRNTDRTGILQNRLIRGLIIALILLIVVIIIGFVALQATRGSRRVAINFDPYPGAQVVSKTDKATTITNGDSTIFSTPDTVEAVYQFYASRFGLIEPQNDGVPDNNNDNGCRLLDNNTRAACNISNSQDEIIQELLMQIQPAADGKTTITINRAWGK